MKVWFVEIGEPLPIEENPRLLRYGMLTKLLATYGHHVTWWASGFSHFAKRHMTHEDVDVFENGVYLKILKGPGYKKSISLQRIKHHKQFAKKFLMEAVKYDLPDIIISPIPTIESAEATIKFAERNGIPVLIDIRDKWPDEIKDLAPKSLRWLSKIILSTYYKKATYICRNATGIMGVSKSFLNYGLEFANRSMRDSDLFLPIGYQLENYDEKILNDATNWWIQQGVRRDNFVCCFFGTIGKFFNLKTVIEATRILSKEFNIQAILCGEGSSLHHYKKMAKGLPSVIFPGWVDSPKIKALMSMSHVGLAPYAANTSMSLPNKPFEYFAGGLPVVSSIQGELRELLTQYDCGRTYHADSVDELCHILRELKQSEELRKSMGKRARQLLDSQYSIEKIASRLNDHIKFIVSDFYPSLKLVE